MTLPTRLHRVACELREMAGELEAIAREADPASEEFARAAIAAHWVRVGAVHAGGREKESK